MIKHAPVASLVLLLSCGARSPLGENGPPEGPSLSGHPGSGSPDASAHEPGVLVSSLALGEGESCAVMSDGTVRCWGYAGFHQLGRIPAQQCGDGGRSEERRVR